MEFPLILPLVVCVASFHVSSALSPWRSPRLPRSLIPFHYELSIQPDFYDGQNFTGTVSIHMTVQKQTKFIIVHAEKLNITDTKVFKNKTISLWLADTFLYDKNNYWVVETAEPMVIGTQIKLDLSFEGQLSRQMGGLYKDGYVDETTGKFRPMLATGFYPYFARLIFPNFDEPFFKSQFTISLRHWANYTAVSNMPEQDSWMIDSVWRETLFKRTYPMNSFLVSFVISNLAYMNNTLLGEMPHRLWVRSDRLAEAEFAFNMTPVIQLHLYKEMPLYYPPQKLDQFVMPYSEGLTGWGLITWSKKLLLLDPILDGEQERQDCLSQLAYHLAYNYVANFVTCRNWDHVWLNLGLAHFYLYKSAWAAEPTMHFEEIYTEMGMAEDATVNSRPLVVYDSTNRPTADNFRLPVGYKGAAVLKMIEGFLGVRQLRRGIKRFIKNNTRGTVVTQHLWDSLQEEIDPNLNISEIMKTWTHSMGFPVISIQLLPDNKINATQKRFLLDARKHLDNPRSIHGYKWYVPLTYQTKAGNFGLVWMNKTDAVFDNPLSADDDWILFNYDQSGYYRVNYDAALWDRITKQLNDNHTVFTEKQRSRLLSDSMKLAAAEQLGYDVSLGLTKYAGRERSLQPWSHITNELNVIFNKLSSTNYSYQSYLLKLTTNIMDELQVDDKGSNSDKLLRRRIIMLACSAGHKGCLENSTRLFEAWIQNETNAVPENIREEVNCMGMYSSLFSSSFAWNTTFERYIMAKSEKYRKQLLFTLICNEDNTLLNKLMDIYISNTSRKILHNDFKEAASKFALQRPNSVYLYQWITLHHQEVINRYTKQAFIDIMLKIADTFDTPAEVDQVIEFIHQLGRAEREKKRFEKRDGFPPEFISELRRRINSNIRWMAINNATIISWFEQNG